MELIPAIIALVISGGFLYAALKWIGVLMSFAAPINVPGVPHVYDPDKLRRMTTGQLLTLYQMASAHEEAACMGGPYTKEALAYQEAGEAVMEELAARQRMHPKARILFEGHDSD